MKINLQLTSNISEVQKCAEYAKAQKGKWFHWERVYLIKDAKKEEYGFVTLNFFERLFRNIFHIHGLKKEFKGKKVIVLDATMQKTSDVSRMINPALRIQNPKLFDIPAKIEAVKEEKDIAKKKAAFEEIYTRLQKEEYIGKDQFLLYSLLEAYASQTLYAQKTEQDNEWGFRRAARLMELSLSMQLNNPVDWARFETLEALTANFDKKPIGLNWLKKTPPQSDAIKDALIRLAYSYQNMTDFNQPTKENIQLHTKLNTMAETLLKNNHKDYAEFAYNRRPFLAGLKNPQDIQGKIKTYQDLIPLFKRALPDFDYKRKEAQILNMMGLILTRANMEPVQALEYFTKADAIHTGLLAEATQAELPTQKFLSANVKSSLIANLCKAGKLDLAKPHYEALKAYEAELDAQNNQHAYREGYKKAIGIYEEAIKK